jgi:hypothetical protein
MIMMMMISPKDTSINFDAYYYEYYYYCNVILMEVDTTFQYKPCACNSLRN